MPALPVHLCAPPRSIPINDETPAEPAEADPVGICRKSGGVAPTMPRGGSSEHRHPAARPVLHRLPQEPQHRRPGAQQDGEEPGHSMTGQPRAPRVARIDDDAKRHSPIRRRQEERLRVLQLHRVMLAHRLPGPDLQAVLVVKIPGHARAGLAPKVLLDIGAAERQRAAMIDLDVTHDATISLADLDLERTRRRSFVDATAPGVTTSFGISGGDCAQAGRAQQARRKVARASRIVTKQLRKCQFLARR
jgi:hypothetical protein